MSVFLYLIAIVWTVFGLGMLIIPEAIRRMHEKMAKIKDTERDDTRIVFTKLNNMIIQLIDDREDADVLHVNYNAIVAEPEENIKNIRDFLDAEDIDVEKMLSVVDKKLYRKRRI